MAPGIDDRAYDDESFASQLTELLQAAVGLVFVARSRRTGWPQHNPAKPKDSKGTSRFVPSFDPENPEFRHTGP